MLPALEGEIRLKDESAQTFDQVVANAMKANQALKGSQAEERLKKSGKDAGDWWGTALTATIRQNTPQELLDILIVELIPLMTKALAAEAERGGVAP